MTEPATTGDAARISAGLEAVARGLKANTAAIDNVKRSTDQRLGRHRFGLTLTVVGLLIDLAISGLFRLFFAAEVDKVSGQVDGLHMIVRGRTVPGLHHFIHASDNYLDHIHRLNHMVDSIALVLAVIAVVCLVLYVLRRRRLRGRLD